MSRYRRKDANASFNENLSNRLAAICQDKGIAFSFKDSYIEALNKTREIDGEKPLSIGSTEMGRIIAASGGLVDGTTLQIPTTGYHTLQETASVSSCHDFINLLTEVAAV